MRLRSESHSHYLDTSASLCTHLGILWSWKLQDKWSWPAKEVAFLNVLFFGGNLFLFRTKAFLYKEIRGQLI